MTKKINEKTVTYRMLIKQGFKYYKLGTIIIKRLEGEFLYTPSQLRIENSGSEKVIGKVIDHVSWHKSGRVHIKTKDGEYDVVEEGVEMLKPEGWKSRQKIEDIGFQEIIRDTVIDVSTLPEYIKKIDGLDVVFDIKDYVGPVQFLFTIVSGTHVVELSKGGRTPVKIAEKSNKIKLDSQLRCLGAESGNADKLLQYILYKYTGEDLQKGRRFFIAGDSGIFKIKSEI
jgi:hypothetical protein